MIAAIYARTILVALGCLLAVATSASAECAWVLWEEYTTSTGHSWSIFSATLGLNDCTSFARRAVADRERGNQVMESEGNHVLIMLEGNAILFRYLCLPDTIDPREPGGGQ